MSDYQPGDCRPEGFVTTNPTMGDEIYIYHHDGYVGLELCPWGRPGESHPTPLTLLLTPDQAEYVVRELSARIDEVGPRRRKH